MNLFAKIVLLFVIIFQLSAVNYTVAQIEGDQGEIKEGFLNSNNISSVVFNYGSIGKPNYLSNIYNFVWNRLGYMVELGTMIAGEVTDNSGNTLRVVSDSHVLAGQGSYSPDGTVKWGWLPRTGYSKPGQSLLATRKNPNSWPAEWGNIWPSEYGAGQLMGLDEAYYVMDDFTNAKFPYYPFPSDSTKRGLGVKAEVRIYQFGGGLKDAVIIKYKLTNESPKLLNKLHFGFFGDPVVGGFNDFSDDLLNIVRSNGIPGHPEYYYARNTIYSWDDDMTGTGGLPAGYLAFKFLKTPGNRGLTSFTPLTYTNTYPNIPKNDVLMWQLFESGLDTASALFNVANDNVILFGTGPFSLQPGETQEIIFSIFCSWSFEAMLKNSVYLHFHHTWPMISSQPGANGGNSNYKISLVSPNSGIISGAIPVTWNYQGTDPNAKVFIEYSYDKGRTWIPLVWDFPITGSYNWNTELVRDGVNYLFRIVAYNPNEKAAHYYDMSDSRFTINNVQNAQPELELLTTFDSLVVTRSPLSLQFSSEDADNSSLLLSLEYAHEKTGPFYPVFTNTNFPSGTNSYQLDISNIPNSTSYYLRLKASDGILDTTVLSPRFEINEQRGYYSSNIFNHTSGISTPKFNLQVVDTSKLKYDTYQLSFKVEQTSKKMFITNKRTGSLLLNNYPMFTHISTTQFDGLKLTVDDQKTRINQELTKFNREILNGSYILGTAAIGNPKIPAREDWILVFNNLDTLQNGQYVFPGDTVKNQSSLNVICPFRILTKPYFQKANYLINESILSLRNNLRWDIQEGIVLRPLNAAGATTSYELRFNFTGNILPASGDTLFIFTYKEIVEQDTFLFTPDQSYVLGLDNQMTINEFEMYQNYPNPFNPYTTIQFTMPSAGKVVLDVYNILGEKIITLLNEERNAGTHKILFDGKNLSSGVYLYTVRFANKIQSRKMLILK